MRLSLMRERGYYGDVAIILVVGRSVIGQRVIPDQAPADVSPCARLRGGMSRGGLYKS